VPDTHVVVVGSGMSGCAIAAEIARHGVPVTVLEAGPDAGRRHVAARADSAAWLDPAADPHFAPFRAGARGGHYDGHSGLRRRAGGRSLYWRGITLRIEPYALADWPQAVRNALEGKAGTGLYDRAEAALERWSGRRLDAARGDREARFVDVVRDHGYPAATATPRAVRVLSERTWEAYSPLTELPPGVLVTGQPVAGLSLEPGGTVAVRCSPGSARGDLRARAVVLCAGTVQNARLAAGLMAAERARAPRSFRIVDHHVQGWVAAFPGTGPVDASVLASRDDEARSNLVVERCDLGAVELVDAWAMGEQLLTDAATFTVDDRGDVDFHPTLTRSDQDVLSRQRELLDAVADALRIDPALRPALDKVPDFDLAVERAKAEPGRAVPYYARLGSLDHESGSLPLSGEWVDVTGRLRGLGPVFVAGPTVFPRAGAANPVLTTLALSRHIVEHLLGSL
jgi:glycine/D-amino acid oxidase-like deaminating enzyme